MMVIMALLAGMSVSISMTMAYINSYRLDGQDIDGEDEGDGSGKSVSLSENGLTVAIGSSSNNDKVKGSGHVRVYFIQ